MRRRKLKFSDRDLENLIHVIKRYREDNITSATMDEETRSLLIRLLNETERRERKFFGERILP